MRDNIKWMTTVDFGTPLTPEEREALRAKVDKVALAELMASCTEEDVEGLTSLLEEPFTPCSTEEQRLREEQFST